MQQQLAPDYFVGLDLGQVQDFTALAILQRVSMPKQYVQVEQQIQVVTPPPTYHVRYLYRFPLGTSYPIVVKDVATLAAGPPMQGEATIAVDQTGVGRAVVDLLRRAPVPGNLVPIVITAGHAVNMGADGSRHVPKKELVSALQVVLQTRRLKIALGLPDAQVLAKELENFRVKITIAANEVYEAWREGQHDDLVLAVAMACWLAERRPQWEPMQQVPCSPHSSWQQTLLQRAHQCPRTGPLRRLFGQ